MSIYNTLIILFLSCTMAIGQQAAAQTDPAFQQEIESYLDHSVNTITVEEAAAQQSQYVFLDAREEEEFMTSHIPDAQYIGHKSFKKSSVEDIDRDTPIIVYCSIGYRSEKIGEKLQKMGFTNVQNLYGSIFEWANQGYPLEDSAALPTTVIHTYNKKWSKWVTNEDYKKVW